MNHIDLVIPWVDGNDPKWQEEINHYLKHTNFNRGYYQDWGWMRYWFRCVEKNMPWIRYVFFITYGHIPTWLNTKHPKLRIINHNDYIPKEFLPTFCSIPIFFNIHRIKDLSETFIYAEDDIFFIGEQKPSDFFSKKGLPKDYFWLMPITEQFNGDFAHLMLNNMLIIKKHFNMEQIINNNKDNLLYKKYPSPLYKDNNKYMSLKYLPGFKESHLAYSFLKSTFFELWEKEELELYKCCKHKFRSITDVCSILVKDWQLATGNYSPYFQKGRYFVDVSNNELENLILDKKTKMLCINESNKLEYSIERSKEICSYFEKRFPEPSSFELL